jgi:hypothetical protein
MQRIYPESGRVAQLLRGGSWNNNIRFRVVCLPQHPSPSEPLEGIQAGAQEGSRPAPVISWFRRLIRTAPRGAPSAHGSAISAGLASLFSLPG